MKKGTLIGYENTEPVILHTMKELTEFLCHSMNDKLVTDSKDRTALRTYGTVLHEVDNHVMAEAMPGYDFRKLKKMMTARKLEMLSRNLI